MIINIPLVAEEDFAEFMRVCEPGTVATDYADYLAGINQFCHRLAELGGRANKIRIDPKALAAWCAKRGCKVDSGARAEYTGLIASRLKMDGN
jgi:hypothetical protein